MGPPPFDDLKTSTRTLMVYTNVEFDHRKVFDGIEVTPIEVPLTKKKKNVDKKRLKAPYGAIISKRYGDELGGINLSKGKNRRCGVCQPMNDGTRNRKPCTVTERLIPSETNPEVKFFRYFCGNCKKLYKGTELDNPLTYFLNQVTIVLATEDLILNIMLFKNSFKIAGCKKNDDAVEATRILWEEYIRPIKGGYTWTTGEHPKFLFHLVMRNVDFRLGFPINRQKLNQLMNRPGYKDKIEMSQCETTSHTNVNIKMHSEKPDDHLDYCLVIPPDKEPYWKTMVSNPYRTKKPPKKQYITFIVFSSAEVILSGRYEKNMKEMYDFFVKETYANKNYIEERIETPKMDLMTYLKKQNVMDTTS